MRSSKQPPLADPVVLAWDAVVRGDAVVPSECDATEFALLRQLHLSDRVPLPADRFFDDLEAYLCGLAPAASREIWQLREDEPRRATATRSPNAERARLLIHTPRRSLTWVAIAAALAIALAGLLVVYGARSNPSEPPAIPAAEIVAPKLETLARFEIDPSMWGMPEAADWQHFEGGLFEVAPGMPFTTNAPWFISVDGPLAITVVRGELTLTPAGPARLFPVVQDGQFPVEIAAGETVTLEPDETIVYSSHTTGEGSNPGSEPALILYALPGIVDNDFPNDMQQSENTTMLVYDDIETSLLIPTAGAVMVLQRIDLAPYDMHVVDVPKEPQLLLIVDPDDMNALRLYDGAIEALSPDLSSQKVHGLSQVRYLVPGPHTFANLGEETVTLFFLTVEPAPSAGTPAR